MATAEDKEAEDFVFPQAKRGPGRPRKDGSTPPSTPTATARAKRRKAKTNLPDIEAGLTSALQDLGKMVVLIEEFDGKLIWQQAPTFSHAWVEVARQNDKVHSALEAVLEGSAWATALTATAMLVLPMLMHHGVMPKSPIFINEEDELAARRNKQRARQRDADIVDAEVVPTPPAPGKAREGHVTV